MKNARQLALDVLIRCETDGAYSTLALQGAHPRTGMDARERAFATSLVYGVTERKLTLDSVLSGHLRQPLKKLNPVVLQILRLGAYQLLFADKIPASAAVNESVRLAKERRVGFAAGLVNAVLRNISKEGLILPDRSDPLRFLSVFASCPEELTARIVNWYGFETAERILTVFLEPRPVFIRVNTKKTDPEALIARLDKEGVASEKTVLPTALRISGFGDLTALQSFRDGDFFVQDLSSQTCARRLGARPGETVVDCCAAPGGKSFSVLLDMDDEGCLIACDKYPHKTELIEKGARRLGLQALRTVCADARELSGMGILADRVLCDVPCSGLGVIGRKPEIKYKTLQEMDALPPLQYDILNSCAALVKPGGTLVYSTCTLNPAENGDVCDRFLAEHPDFSVAEESGPCADRYETILPSAAGGDGFFIAGFRRGTLHEN